MDGNSSIAKLCLDAECLSLLWFMVSADTGIAGILEMIVFPSIDDEIEVEIGVDPPRRRDCVDFFFRGIREFCVRESCTKERSIEIYDVAMSFSIVSLITFVSFL